MGHNNYNNKFFNNIMSKMGYVTSEPTEKIEEDSQLKLQ